MARSPKTKGLRDLSDVSLSESSWKTKAACKDKETSLFFSTPKSDQAIVAMAICRSCPVRAECFYESLQYGYYGIWCGSNLDQRLAIIAVMLNYDLSSLTRELSDSYLQYIDRIGRTKNTAIADLVHYKSSTTD